jgi:hypothetical protein
VAIPPSISGGQGPLVDLADQLGAEAGVRLPLDECEAERTLLLAVLRGALLDLLASGDAERTTAAVRRFLS